MRCTIYRVEHREHLCGPYADTYMLPEGYCDRLYGLLEHHNNRDTHPTPDEDQIEGGWMMSSEVCGFQSMEQLRDWFSVEELLGLHEMDFVVSRYEVDDGHVRHGRRQSIFEREEAEVTLSHPIDLLLAL